ncbi:DASH complex subunit Duo1-domain-containing protein [Lipomyces arxii]|uniref:DASH complex subunit Duo1-domain-containing protein n=1 Tax=Lipomyces arxii TaxID=56418 RepID=UPI0034CD91FA
MPTETDNLSASLQKLAVSLNESHSEHTSSANAREERLLQELDQIRSVNETITAVLDSISVAESNLEKVVATTKNVDSLMSLWIRILSQTEHTQRVIFDPKWEGSSKDEQLHQQRLAELAEKQAQALAQAQLQAQQQAAATQQRKETEEHLRTREATLQKRIYGTKGLRKPGTASVKTVSAKTVSATSSVPARQRTVLKNASNTTSASRTASSAARPRS